MIFPRELVARIDASLARSQTAPAPSDGLDEIAIVALGLAKGDRDVARGLILNDFEDWLSRTGRLNSSYSFTSYPQFQKGKRRASLFGALAWTYLLPKRTISLHQYA
ncbi:hypothetical protein CXZ10_09280 [Pleomorphomonas diazotrophica]|uniref:Uncharacterized protein n=1 Tax=Pleomorphomonas diazotrophica TaxID=1166257 RepID=A0A1I4T5I8_9HYPH|nr:hypothetical protein [Pleomorphomonas diazotrophica]PKR89553.1 hypothetical protein CXZ10_09280 [Pleomorphomonas diazotrophica]SFM71911.1 hypothetical protein SAMN05192571_1054 [Pleomorphomonas diazotrophica]